MLDFGKEDRELFEEQHGGPIEPYYMPFIRDVNKRTPAHFAFVDGQ